MQVFIVAKTVFNIPSILLQQKILDWAALEYKNNGAECFVVGEITLDTGIEKHFQQLTEPAAVALLAQSSNAKIVHFGYTIKGGEKWPQYFIPLYYPNEDRDLSFLKKWTAQRAFNRYTQRATRTICLNDSVKERLSATNTVLPLATLKKYEWATLAATKEQLTDGHPYFLAFLEEQELIGILKEFSIFKKWQQTNMHIVLVFPNQAQLIKAEQAIKGYKFRTDVIMVDIKNFQLEWMAAAYITLWSHCMLSHSFMLEWAVFWEVPVLYNANQHPLPLSWQNVGEIFNFLEPMALSNHFKLYYKDELYRQARAGMGTVWLNTINSTFAS